jgi:hypothetical protein
VWELVISCSSEVIARHSRSYGREELIFNPLHYLALLEQKSNALERRPPRLDLENYPHLPMADMALTRAADYQVLLQQAI